jgi:aldose 1-epimerase
MTTLLAGDLTLDLAPEVGGSVAAFRKGKIDLMRPLTSEARARRDPLGVAMFPMVPHANIIAGNRFSFEGETFVYEQNLARQRFNVHGTGWQSPWLVESAGASEAVLRLDRPHDPCPYAAQQRFVLTPAGLSVTTRVTNSGGRRAPFGFGQHPWFPRDPDVTLAFEAGHFWMEGPDHIATERLRTPPELDFVHPRGLPSSWRNNCYGSWVGRAEIRFPSRGLGLTIEADPVFKHLMFYADPTQTFFCLEPQTNAVCAFNKIDRDRDEDLGLIILEPGASAEGTMTFTPFDIEGS